MKESNNKSIKLLSSFLFKIFAASFIVGILFKINHYPLQDLLYLSGITGLLITYILWFIFTREKTTYNYLLLIFFFLWLGLSLITELCIPYSFTLIRISSVSLLTWLFLLIFNPSNSNPKQSKRQKLLQNIPFILATVLILVGAISKINHFPGATIMLFLGLVFGLVWFAISMVGNKK